MSNEPHRVSTQMNSFITTFSSKCICWLLLNKTKHKQSPNCIPSSPNLKTLDLQMSWFTAPAVAAKGIPFPVWVECAFNLACIVFADNNTTITVIWAFIERVCQPLYGALCMQCLLLSPSSALLVTDFWSENQGSEERSRSPRCPATVCRNGLSVEFLRVFLTLLLSSFRLGHLAYKALSVKNIPCGAVSAFPFAVSWCKERENNTGQYF